MADQMVKNIKVDGNATSGFPWCGRMGEDGAPGSWLAAAHTGMGEFMPPGDAAHRSSHDLIDVGRFASEPHTRVSPRRPADGRCLRNPTGSRQASDLPAFPGGKFLSLKSASTAFVSVCFTDAANMNGFPPAGRTEVDPCLRRVRHPHFGAVGGKGKYECAETDGNPPRDPYDHIPACRQPDPLPAGDNLIE